MSFLWFSFEPSLLFSILSFVIGLFGAVVIDIKFSDVLVLGHHCFARCSCFTLHRVPTFLLLDPFIPVTKYVNLLFSVFCHSGLSSHLAPDVEVISIASHFFHPSLSPPSSLSPPLQRKLISIICRLRHKYSDRHRDTSAPIIGSSSSAPPYFAAAWGL